MGLVLTAVCSAVLCYAGLLVISRQQAEIEAQLERNRRPEE